MPGFQFWRRPTLAQPIVALPSGLQRFTSVFGMGTGGATALLSPESDAGLAVDASHRKVRDRVSGDKPSKNNRFSDIYIQEVFTTSGFVLLIFRSHSSQFSAPSC